MRKNLPTILILGALLAGTVACEEEKAPPVEEKKEEQVAATPAEKSAEEKAKEEAEKKALDEAEKKKAEAEAAEAKLKENPLTECCRSLAQIAMFKRSAPHKAGETICGGAMQDKKTLDAVRDKIKEKLEGAPLPEPCQ